MTTRTRVRLLLAALACLTATGLLIAADVHPLDPLWKAPVSASSQQNPLAQRQELGAGGARTFNDRCFACHGEGGRGTTDGPDLGAPAVQEQSDGALFWKISSGNTHGGMPSFSFLPEARRWQVVLHLRALGVTRQWR